MTNTLPRLSTGIAGMDEVLGGGFIAGGAYIIQGHPGAGKTILSNQVAFTNAAMGRKVLYVTLLSETHERLFSALSTLDFFDRDQLGNGVSYVSVFQTLRDEGLEAVVSLLRRETARQGASLLVFDGLLNARDRGDSDLDIKTFLAEVQAQAAFVGCTVLFLTSARLTEVSPEHTMVDGVIELHEDVVGVRSVRRLQVRKSRGSASLGGYHQYQITSSGIVVFPRIEAVYADGARNDEPSEKRIATNVAGLDKLVGGGFPEGSVTLTFGPSGSGKTSLGLSFLAGSNSDEPGLYFGFYETPQRIVSKSRALHCDISNKVEDGSIEIIHNPMAENLLDRLGHQLLDAVRERKVKRLVIDGAGGFERAAVDRHRLVEFMAVLTNELRRLGCTSIVTWELRELFGPTVSAPGSEISSLLDNLMMLRQIELQSRYHRTISLLKIRDSAFNPAIHEFTIGNQGIEIALPLEPVNGAATGLAAPVQL